MRLCSFEDARVLFLEPLTLTRPAFALRCGAMTLLEWQRRVLGADEIGGWVRPELAPVSRLLCPGLPINDAAWLGSRQIVFVNARWLPRVRGRLDPRTPQVGMVGEQVAYLVLPEPALLPTPARLGDWLAEWKERLPQRQAGGVLLDFLWDCIAQNPLALVHSYPWFQARHGQRALPSEVAVLGPAERVVLAAGVEIEPFSVIDARQGPVLIDEGAVIQTSSRLEGPCYIGKNTQVFGARVRGGSTLGPECRVGGEIEASILQGYVNKQHDGFLGHSYIGEWVNLGAGTQSSDLRNDYGEVRVSVNGQRLGTGQNKVGAFLGDHVKTGLGTLLNTGSSVGAFANLLPSGELLPNQVPSFCQVVNGTLQELWDLRKLFGTAALVMRRRGQELTEAHYDLYDGLYEATAEARRRTVREGEMRWLRRSI
jgi:UDP-N-acetylglucosamine diphosphorylase/glucosamine-1-phosphate N-acetyltransferase